MKIKLTHSLIHSAGSFGGHGFNRRQFDLLGVNWPPKQGWLHWLIGREIDQETWREVLELKGQAKWKLKQQKKQNYGNQH